MADNETLVTWRFDVDKCFSIICATGCVMMCTIWTKTAPSRAILVEHRDHFVHFGGVNATPLKSTKNIVKTMVLATWACWKVPKSAPTWPFFTRKIIQKPRKTQGFWPEASLNFGVSFSCFVFSMQNAFFHTCVFYLNRSSIFRDLGLVFPIFVVFFLVFFSRPVLELYNANIEFDLQNTALSGLLVCLLYTKKLGF